MRKIPYFNLGMVRNTVLRQCFVYYTDMMCDPLFMISNMVFRQVILYIVYYYIYGKQLSA